MKRTEVGDLEKEAFGFMPKRFVLFYYSLVEAAMKTDAGAQDYEQKLLDGGAKGSSTGSDGGLKSEKARHTKSVVDQRLRRLVAEIEDGEKGPQCRGCKIHLRDTWKWCPNCGRQLGPVPPKNVGGAVQPRTHRFGRIM